MNNNGIVMGSGIKLSRNIKGIPFPNKMNKGNAEHVQKAVFDAFGGFDNFDFLPADSLDERKKVALIERFGCGTELLKSKLASVLIAKNIGTVITLNAEDHVSIQCSSRNFELEALYATACGIQDILEKSIEFSFDPQLGYLTASPSNVGTGLKASAAIHLAGVSLTKQTEHLIMSLTKLGCTVEGIYGDGAQTLGSIFRVSNQYTLGLTEQEIIKAQTDIVSQLAEQEMHIREAVNTKNPNELADMCLRSLGVCRYARRLSFNELVQHVSNIKFGASLGILDVTQEASDKLLEECGMSLEGVNGTALNSEAELAIRAKRANDILKTY